MELNLHLCAIEINELKRVIGSKNEKMVQDIAETKIFHYFNQNNIWSLSLKEIIRQIIFNEKKNNSFAGLYTNGLICIIEFLKKEMPYNKPIQLSFATDAVNEILSLDFDIVDDIEVAFFLNRLDIGIPLSTEVPLTGIMSDEDLKHWSELLAPVEIPITHTNPSQSIADDIVGISERDKAYSFIMGIKQNFAFCIQNNLELFIYTKRESFENL